MRGSYIARTSNPGRTRFSAGGVGRNIAHNLATLGVETSLIAAIGMDDAGDMVMAETANAGVDVTMLLRVEETADQAPMWRCLTRQES